MKVRVVFFLFVYLVAANLPFWIASHSMGFLWTGVFNIELVLVGILSLFVRRAVTVSLLLIAMLLDVLRGVNSTYLLTPLEMMRAARSLFAFAPSHLGGLLALSLCMGIVCFLATVAYREGVRGRERDYLALALAVFLVVCWARDARMGLTSPFRPSDYRLGTLRLTRFPAHSLVMSEVQGERFSHMRSAGVHAPVPAASKLMVAFDNASVVGGRNVIAPNVVLILVESWGKPLAGELEDALTESYRDKDLEEKYTMSSGTVPFYGPTVAGEARELCGSAMGFGLLSASRAELKQCLPATMNAMGYHSMAVHGYSERMFDRGEWYARIGFEQTWFRERLRGEGLPVCPGPFPGICDAAASAWIGDQLQKSSDSPQFIYWVTLNSHLPVPVSNGVKDPPSCSDHSMTAEAPALCAWYQLVFNVHRSVARMALRSTTRPTVFLIVGDHAPPFTSTDLRSEFSDRVVPYLLLRPKGGEGVPTNQPSRSLFAAAHPRAGSRRLHPKRGTALSVSAAGG